MGIGNTKKQAEEAHREIQRLRQQLTTLQAERRQDALDGQAALDEANNAIKTLEEELGRQAAMLERDRTLVADCVTSMRKALASREWLRLGRGSYEYNDDRWRDEFGQAWDEIMAEVKKLRSVAENWEGCPKTQAEVIAARKQIKHPTQEPTTEQEGCGE